MAEDSFTEFVRLRTSVVLAASGMAKKLEQEGAYLGEPLLKGVLTLVVANTR